MRDFFERHRETTDAIAFGISFAVVFTILGAALYVIAGAATGWKV